MNPLLQHMLALTVLGVASGAGLTQDKGEAVERIDVTVSGANGPILIIDRGASSGIQKGDTVVFRRVGLPPLVGAVRRVDEHEARVELEDLGQGALTAVGLRGEVLVPRGRAVPDGTRAEVPEHPEWQEPVGTWAPGTPLLAPASSPDPEDRNHELRGRVYTRYQYTDDSQVGRTYSRWWTGFDMDATNPFNQGGSLRFKGDISYRDYLTGSDRSDETLLRMQRFSYRVGGNFDEPNRLEVGRFLHSLFPQFGLIDGAEYVRRFDGGDQLGASIGFLPDYTDNLAASDDLSTTLFYRWVEGPEEHLAVGAGYQKTWHSGTADRDLFAGSLDWILGPNTSARGSLLVDYYDSSAQLKDPGFELTELHASLNQRLGDNAGASLYGSYLAWPELLKNDFPIPPPATISDQKLARGGANAWLSVARGIRVYGRFDLWTDNQNSGSYADLRVDLRDRVYEGSELSLGVYQTQGSFSDGLGARIRHTHWFSAASLRIGYETVRYDQNGFLGSQSQLLQHLLRLGLDSRLARDVDLSLDADQRFGDEQDSFTVGLRLTWQF